MGKTNEYRTIFLSDLHLGTKSCRAKELGDFLKDCECKEIYLLGDVIDMSAIRRNYYWDCHHNTVIRRFFKLAQRGVKITYIAGNRDGNLNQFINMNFAGIRIAEEMIYTTIKGQRYLLLHGDKFDGVFYQTMWQLYTLGGRWYGLAKLLNWPMKLVKHLRGDVWSPANYLKNEAKDSEKVIADFEQAITAEAKAKNVDGVICGHIHAPSDITIDNLRYLNCGCWTDHCTFVAETLKGNLTVEKFD